MINVNYNKFAEYLISRESPENEVNSMGAMGYYQFMPSTLNSLQVKYDLPPWVDVNNFVGNRSLQDLYYKANVNDLLKIFDNNGLTNFIGQSRKAHNGHEGIINIYGLLAGAWLGGPGNLYDYLVHGVDRDDNPHGEGTYISDYLIDFSNYPIDSGTTLASLNLLIPLLLGAGIFF